LHRVRPPISRSNGLGNGVAPVQSNTQTGRTVAAAGFEQSEIELLRAAASRTSVWSRFPAWWRPR
jgi:hypothetical protein